MKTPYGMRLTLGVRPCIISAWPNMKGNQMASSMLPPPPTVDLDGLFRGFADPTRLRILNVLCAGELCVSDIVEVVGLPQPAVSRHLAYLRRSGLVAVTRDWKL